ncbi:GNAT family N-acetyltransferase [Paenibacillus sacheonensis]|uniref:GNAT family N-acetyltransferase n=1 Tax=Paenibacillus sacheonensis TaxID=742054 RepID=A0A7X4YSY8_9BACL|nr:GNAT family N-acetyltransferase [Paenibacillus sacheonensis]MBM7567112.1 putative acetyltransferase [Paenibacillus sacheonensis]NBC70959.1 GNAT family N-acetyltransferase [Paenibacillus sacheonensis]
MIIREIQPRDDAAVERIIRSCLIEFGANRAGLAWEDESLSHLSAFYATEECNYWVVEEEGAVVGGCGIAPFAESGEICELQKMYLLPHARGTGAAAQLLAVALAFAGRHYRHCYLETLTAMAAANRFYVKHGFVQLEAPLAGSEHFACDAWYMKDLAERG